MILMYVSVYACADMIYISISVSIDYGPQLYFDVASTLGVTLVQGPMYNETLFVLCIHKLVSILYQNIADAQFLHSLHFFNC